MYQHESQQVSEFIGESFPLINELLQTQNGVDIYATRKVVAVPHETWCRHGPMPGSELTPESVLVLLQEYEPILSDDVGLAIRREKEQAWYGLRHPDGAICCEAELIDPLIRWRSKISPRHPKRIGGDLEEIGQRVVEKMLRIFRDGPRYIANPSAYFSTAAKSLLATECRRCKREANALRQKAYLACASVVVDPAETEERLEAAAAKINREGSSHLRLFFEAMRSQSTNAERPLATDAAMALGLSPSAGRVYKARLRRLLDDRRGRAA